MHSRYTPIILLSMLLAASAGARADKGGTIDVAAHLPLVLGAPIRFVATGDAAEPLQGVFLDPHPPIAVRTTRPPDGVLVVGLGLDGVDFSRLLEGRPLREMRRLQAMLPITSGSILALLPGDPEPALAAVLPLRDPLPAKVVARRAKRALRALDIRTEQVDPTHLVLDLEGSVFHLRALDGRLVLSDSLPLIYDIAADTGQLWVQGELAERAATYPLVFSTTLLPDEGEPLHLDPPFSLALDFAGGVLRGEVVVPLTMQQLVEYGESAAGRFKGDSAPEGSELPPFGEDGPQGQPAPGGRVGPEGAPEPLDDPPPLDDPAPPELPGQGPEEP